VEGSSQHASARVDERVALVVVKSIDMSSFSDAQEDRYLRSIRKLGILRLPLII
jgi:hypothetical protein